MSAAMAKAEKKKQTVNLPMRGRHMYIADKVRDQIMCTENLKQANENDQINIEHQ
jgi:hypothetical protein